MLVGALGNLGPGSGYHSLIGPPGGDCAPEWSVPSPVGLLPLSPSLLLHSESVSNALSDKTAPAHFPVWLG